MAVTSFPLVLPILRFSKQCSLIMACASHHSYSGTQDRNLGAGAETRWLAVGDLLLLLSYLTQDSWARPLCTNHLNQEDACRLAYRPI